MAYHGVPQPRAPGRLFGRYSPDRRHSHHPHAAPPRSDVRLGGGHVLRGQHLLAKALPPWGYGGESKSKTAPLKTLNMVVLLLVPHYTTIPRMKICYHYYHLLIYNYGINYHILSLELIVIISFFLKKIILYTPFLIVIYISYAHDFIVFAVTSGICYPQAPSQCAREKRRPATARSRLGVAFGLLQIRMALANMGITCRCATPKSTLSNGLYLLRIKRSS